MTEKEMKCKHEWKIVHGVYCNYRLCVICGKTYGKVQAFNRSAFKKSERKRLNRND